MKRKQFVTAILVALFTSSFSQNLQNLTLQIWSAEQWVNSYSIDYTYDSNDAIATETTKSWDATSGIWGDLLKRTNTRNPDGTISIYESQFWSNGVWTNNEKRTYTYGVNGNMLTELVQQWKGGSYVNNWYKKHSYDSNGYRVGGISDWWNPATSSWDSSGLTVVMNNADGTIDTSVTKKWFNGVLENRTEQFYTYTINGDILNSVWQSVKGDKWVSSSQYNYTYDSDNYLIKDDRRKWDAVSGTFGNEYEVSYINNANGKPLIGIQQDWKSSAWVNTNKQIYTYPNSVGLQNINKQQLTIFPNPLNDVINVKGLTEKATYMVYDLSGSEILSGITSSSIDVSSLSYGIYNLTLFDVDGGRILAYKVLVSQYSWERDNQGVT